MAVQKGKAATKGQKQILEENKSCITFYTIMSAVAMIIYSMAMCLFFSEYLSIKFWIVIVFSGSVYLVCLSVLKYMAKPVFSSSGALIDGGTDLNMENGFAENLKDLIILTAIVETLSTFSYHFWFLWLFAPFRAVYMLWVNILGPWFFQQQPEQQQMDDKKTKKIERKMKRNQ